MSELDPVQTPAVGPHKWWHSVHGPMDPLAAQYLAITWPRDNHAPTCPFYNHYDATPYDCDCVRRAQAIEAAKLLRDSWRDGRWA